MYTYVYVYNAYIYTYNTQCIYNRYNITYHNVYNIWILHIFYHNKKKIALKHTPRKRTVAKRRTPPSPGRVVELWRELWHAVGGGSARTAASGHCPLKLHSGDLMTQQCHFQVCVQHPRVHLFTQSCELGRSQQHYLYGPCPGSSHWRSG